MSEIGFTHTGDPTADRKTRRQAKDGTLRQIVPRVCTTNLRDPVAAVLRRNIWAVPGKLHPGAVISGRSAALARPACRIDAEGRETGPAYVFLTDASRRSISLPGLQLRVAAGRPGPLPIGAKIWLLAGFIGASVGV
jgi:hypothetical protein